MDKDEAFELYCKIMDGSATQWEIGKYKCIRAMSCIDKRFWDLGMLLRYESEHNTVDK